MIRPNLVYKNGERSVYSLQVPFKEALTICNRSQLLNLEDLGALISASKAKDSYYGYPWTLKHHPNFPPVIYLRECIFQTPKEIVICKESPVLYGDEDIEAIVRGNNYDKTRFFKVPKEGERPEFKKSFALWAFKDKQARKILKGCVVTHTADYPSEWREGKDYNLRFNFSDCRLSQLVFGPAMFSKEIPADWFATGAAAHFGTYGTNFYSGLNFSNRTSEQMSEKRNDDFVHFLVRGDCDFQAMLKKLGLTGALESIEPDKWYDPESIRKFVEVERLKKITH